MKPIEQIKNEIKTAAVNFTDEQWDRYERYGNIPYQDWMNDFRNTNSDVDFGRNREFVDDIVEASIDELYVVMSTDGRDMDIQRFINADDAVKCAEQNWERIYAQFNGNVPESEAWVICKTIIAGHEYVVFDSQFEDCIVTVELKTKDASGRTSIVHLEEGETFKFSSIPSGYDIQWELNKEIIPGWRERVNEYYDEWYETNGIDAASDSDGWGRDEYFVVVCVSSGIYGEYHVKFDFSEAAEADGLPCLSDDFGELTSSDIATMMRRFYND